jgi:hypothetical protein
MGYDNELIPIKIVVHIYILCDYYDILLGNIHLKDKMFTLNKLGI